MVGGRRCGKTSALASTFDQIINGPVKDYFTVSDDTEYETKETDNGFETQDVLSDKQLELESRLESPTDDFFIVDRNPTYGLWTYKLRLTVPGTRQSMDIEFADVPGEWFAPKAGKNIDKHTGKMVSEIIKERVNTTDVFIVMVDTPYLMHERESIAKASNSVAGIHDYLTHISDDEGKLVIFSPIKCEMWVKKGKMDDVVERLKRIYESTITALTAYPKMNICIMPIETAGNILFFEYGEPLLLVDAGSKPCKKINDKYARLGNGDLYSLKGNEQFNLDSEALISGDIMRPYSWYHINQSPTATKLYAPYNCEQIPLHIVDFMLKKMIRQNPGGILGWIWQNIFGGISKQTLQSKLSEMRSKGIIKENVDHIKYLKRYS